MTAAFQLDIVHPEGSFLQPPGGTPARCVPIYGHARDNVSKALGLAVRKPSGNTPGIDGRVANHYEKYGIEKAGAELRASMAGGRYRFAAARQQAIAKPAGGDRMISILTIADRAAETAVRWGLEPLTHMPDTVHGFVPGRGPISALDRIEAALTTPGVTHILEADVAGYFPSILHDDIYRGLTEVTADKYVHRFIRRLLHRRGQVTEPGRGVLQGSPLSPLLSNIAFKELDLQLASMSEVVALVRYADDLVVFVRGGDGAGDRVHHHLGDLLSRHGLSFAPHKTHLRPAYAWSGSLGHVFRRTRSGGAEIRPSVANIERLHDKLAAACLASRASRETARGFQSWLPMFRQGWCAYFRPRSLAERLFDTALAAIVPPMTGGR